MLKKRLVFTLLYMDDFFMLSRNFRLQRVGNLSWLQRNYVFTNISEAVDELVVLNVSRSGKGSASFPSMLAELSRSCFIPISAGGGIRNVHYARELLRAGADKIVVNTSAFSDCNFIENLAGHFGRQCIVVSTDVSRSTSEDFQIVVEGGQRPIAGNAHELIRSLGARPIGDLYLNSIDRDGTGQGFDTQTLDLIPPDFSIPVILAGGAGNVQHLEMGLSDDRVDAVATAHLLNFVGDGLYKARNGLITRGIRLPLRSGYIRDLERGDVS